MEWSPKVHHLIVNKKIT